MARDYRAHAANLNDNPVDDTVPNPTDDIELPAIAPETALGSEAGLRKGGAKPGVNLKLNATDDADPNPFEVAPETRLGGEHVNYGS